MKLNLSKRTAALLATAGLLLSVGTVSSTLAAKVEETDKDYAAKLTMNHLAVEIVEGESSEYKLTSDENSAVKVGYEYAEDIDVANTSDVDQYQRVIIRKYWTDAEGNKLTALPPNYINVVVDEGNWHKYEGDATGAETTIYYHSGVVEKGESVDLITSLSIDPKSLTDTVVDGKVISAKFNGACFHVEIEADAVQTTNADEAVMAAWGVPASLVIDK